MLLVARLFFFHFFLFLFHFLVLRMLLCLVCSFNLRLQEKWWYSVSFFLSSLHPHHSLFILRYVQYLLLSCPIPKYNLLFDFQFNGQSCPPFHISNLFIDWFVQKLTEAKIRFEMPSQLKKLHFNCMIYINSRNSEKLNKCLNNVKSLWKLTQKINRKIWPQRWNQWFLCSSQSLYKRLKLLCSSFFIHLWDF